MEKVKTPVKEIRIRRDEGRIEQCYEITVHTWTDADLLLRGWAVSAPKEGGYHKVDFQATWEHPSGAADKYEGRFDMKYEHTQEVNLLKRQIKDSLLFYAGKRKPNHMTDEQYQDYLKSLDIDDQECLHFMGRCDLGL